MTAIDEANNIIDDYLFVADLIVPRQKPEGGSVREENQYWVHMPLTLHDMYDMSHSTARNQVTQSTHTVHTVQSSHTHRKYPV